VKTRASPVPNLDLVPPVVRGQEGTMANVAPYNQNALPLPLALWDGLPSTDLDKWVKQLMAALYAMAGDNGYSLGQAAAGLCPGQANWAGAAPNAATLAQTQSRCIRASAVILTKIKENTPPYRTYGAPPFNDDPVLILLDINNNYLLPISPKELLKRKKDVEEFTMADIDMAKEQKNSVLAFSAKLQTKNDLLPVASQKDNDELGILFLQGLHEKLYWKASPEITAATMVFPANIPAGYPNAGNPHPNAGERNIKALENAFHSEFVQHVEKGLIRLPSATASARVVDANALFNGPRFVPHKPPYVKCIRCYGLGHFANLCGTVRGEIPTEILSKITYGDIPLRKIFSGRGKGRGGKGRGGGRFRGGRNPPPTQQVNLAETEGETEETIYYEDTPNEEIANLIQEGDEEYVEEEQELPATIDVNSISVADNTDKNGRPFMTSWSTIFGRNS
jgi:hypothetical protein